MFYAIKYDTDARGVLAPFLSIIGSIWREKNRRNRLAKREAEKWNK
jgi:hypothetical protein